MLKIKKIHLLVLKSFLGPLLLTFFIAMFILLMQFLWKYVDDLVGKGLEWYVIAELLFYASSTFVPLALPLAILLSSLMTFGNFGENYELVAMKSAGISLRKIMLPLVMVSVALSIFAFYFSNNVLPFANLKFKSLLYDVKEQKLALDIKEGIFYHGIDGYVIRVAKKGDDGQTIEDVMIYDHTMRRGNINLTVADSGIMKMAPDSKILTFTLFNGYNYLERTDQRDYRDDKQFQRSKFDKQFRRFDLIDFELTRTDEDLFKKNYKMMNLDQLRYAEDSIISLLIKKKEDFYSSVKKKMYFYYILDATELDTSAATKVFYTNVLEDYNESEQLRIIETALNEARHIRDHLKIHQRIFRHFRGQAYRHQVEWHRKFTLSFTCLVFFFIGAPLGAIIRKGGLGLPIVVSVVFFVFYYIISMTAEKSVKSGVMDAMVGMWFASLILLPIGIFLTIKATTDSPLLDTEAWSKFLKKLTSKFRKKN